MEKQCDYLGCDTFQIFAKNQLRWESRPLNPKEISTFKEFVQTKNIEKFVVHASYLLNLASINSDIREKSIKSLKEELKRADDIGASYLVLHPGSPKRKNSTKDGIKNVIDALCKAQNAVHLENVKIAVENTAGGGNLVGRNLHELLSIVEGVEKCGFEIGVCIDTAHAFESGYTLDARFIDEMHTLFKSRIFVFHINDSLTEKGSKRDRHANIGDGLIPTEFFKLLLNDKRFQKVPFILETPGGLEKFKKDLKTLRSMIL